MRRLSFACAIVLSTAVCSAHAQSSEAVVVPPPPTATVIIAPAPPTAQPVVVAPLPSQPYLPMRPPRPEPIERTNWPVLGSGIAMLAGGWALGWLTTVIWNLASADCTPSGFLGVSCTVRGPYGAGDWQMAIPLVGPWLTFTTDTFRGADVWFPILVGLLQPAGLVMIVVGATTPTRRQGPTVRVTPTPLGIAITGTF